MIYGLLSAKYIKHRFAFMLNYMRKKSLLFITISIIMTSFFVSCKKERKDIIDYAFDPYAIPMMHTDSVDMTISMDSGYVKYRLLTKVWDIYDATEDPYWFFPEKVYLEQYDTLGKVIATVKADTAWNYSRKKLWKLKGNVIVRNIDSAIFRSEEVYWDQRIHKIYSDKYVEVDQPDKGTLIGSRGFEANEQMTEYTFRGVVNSKVIVNEK